MATARAGYDPSVRHVCPECGDAGDRGTCARDGMSRAPVGSDALLGERIGSWRVASLLGAGGMGRVYKAVQPEIGARVAIKVLKREAASDPDLVERFFNEARAVNVIRHDSIVDVIDLGRLPDGAPYIVMEYLEGASLNALLRRPGRLPLGTFARWMAEALDALAAAHAKGIVHRDLKPDNIFISPTGRVTVLDFGIAKLGDLAGIVGGTTQTGSLLGTPAYMAPEQARSQPVDARADLYAAGVILFEGTTGKQPFSAASLYELLDMHVKVAPPSPRSLEPTLPAAVESLILRALAKDPADRFESAAAMKAALLAAVAELPSEAFAPIMIESPAKSGPPSDPYAATAATHSTQASLAHGETMPSTPPASTPEPRRGVVVSRSLVFGLGGAAVLGIGAVVVMMARSPSSSPAPQAPVVVVPVDALVVPVVERMREPPPDAAAMVAAAPVDASAPADAKRRSPVDAAPVIAQTPTPPAFVDAGAPVDAPPSPPPPPASTKALFESGTVSLALGDLRHFDVFGGMTRLRTLGERLTEGKLSLFSANWAGVDRNGQLDATAGGWATYTFVRTDVREKDLCIFEVDIHRGQALGSLGSADCGPNRVISTSCTITQIWDKALAAGMPATTQRIHLNRIGRMWSTSLADTEPTKWSETIRDDCEP